MTLRQDRRENEIVGRFQAENTLPSRRDRSSVTTSVWFPVPSSHLRDALHDFGGQAPFLVPSSLVHCSHLRHALHDFGRQAQFLQVFATKAAGISSKPQSDRPEESHRVRLTRPFRKKRIVHRYRIPALELPGDDKHKKSADAERGSKLLPTEQHGAG